jgi:hypothetical protein
VCQTNADCGSDTVCVLASTRLCEGGRACASAQGCPQLPRASLARRELEEVVNGRRGSSGG